VNWNEWTQIVAKLNASFPGQQIEPPTAREWFDELHGYAAGEVWLAIRLLRKEEKFRPGLAEIITGIKLCRRDMADAKRIQEQKQGTRNLGGGRGGPMPPETQEALKILAEASKPENGIDKVQARAMIESLGQQIIDRAARSEQAGAAITAAVIQAADGIAAVDYQYANVIYSRTIGSGT